jgi:transcriptional regulator with GAF, ATPase, and Fis domain
MNKPEALWDDMCRLLDRVVTAADRDRFLDECLDTLVEQLRAERALVFAQDPAGTASVLSARGEARDLDPAEREEISKTIVRRVVDSGESLIWRPAQGVTESIEALSITAAIAVPLREVAWKGDENAGETRGVLYVDFRDILREIEDTEVEFVRGAASLVSLVLAVSQRLQLAREDLRVAKVREESTGELPSLEEMLWPPKMHTIRKEVMSALRGDSSILILGESGTGKTLLARAIADAAGKTPVVRATLGASDDLNTITSELFGHEKGAFSGAVTKRTGLVELAKGGVLILDEILNLPKHAQQLLLDFTQFGTYRPLGYEGAEPKRVKVRIIAATNGDLEAATRDGRFRVDLYYRFSQVMLKMPPLRDRREEIPQLAEGFLQRIDPARVWILSVPLRRLLISPQLPWPGNVRQLEAMVRRARERALTRDQDTETLTPEDFALEFGSVSPGAVTDVGSSGPPISADALGERWGKLQAERTRLDEAERQIIGAALTKFGGVVSRAARELDVPRTSLLSRMNTLGLGGK